MREFVYFSRRAHTSGVFTDLMKAGRLDIACHVIIASFFLSHALRQDVRLHMIFTGPPDPPKHLVFESDPEMPISKKDVSGLIKRMLFKYKKGRFVTAFPGCSIEKKGFADLIEELVKANRNIYYLDPNGESLRKAKIKANPVFVLGDHEGLGKPEKKILRRLGAKRISIGPVTYFSSQVVTIVHNELDLRGL